MLKRTRKTFITSDLHLGHSNIIKYCNRPYKVSGSNSNPDNIPEVKEMNNDIISMFGSLPFDCDIWNLGDVFFPGFFGKELVQKFEAMQQAVNALKGYGCTGRRLFLVLGNHDDMHTSRDTVANFYRKLGFDEVYDTPVILEDKYILSHEPVYIKPGSNFINLYGHTHDLDIDPAYFCYDYENYAMNKRVFESHKMDAPQPVLRYPEKVVDLNNYKNMCLDKNKGILEWEGDYFKVAATFYRRNPIEEEEAKE